MSELLCIELGTPSGDVILSGPVVAVEEVVRRGNAYDAQQARIAKLEEQVAALLKVTRVAARLPYEDEDRGLRWGEIPRLVERARDALALVRGEVDNE